jgi:ribosomal protein S18 acetylase RimI-like enzyme
LARGDFGVTGSAAAGPVRHTRPAALDDVRAIAALHQERFPGGFLPSLGARTLERLYRHLVVSTDAFVLVSNDADGVVGFVAVTEDTRDLYRGFLRRYGLITALVAAPQVLRAPRKVWETVRYGNRADHERLPSAEILAVAVLERARGTGVAPSLISAALDELRRRGIGAARVVTATGNVRAHRLDERAGFRPERRTEVHRGVPQDVLVWP